jgi:hypothetical protein
LIYSTTWKDSPLIIGAQDILTAYDSVEHVDMFETLWDSGASAHQLLALTRDYHQLKVNLSIPGVASAEGIVMSKALRTGGKYEPHAFVHMFDSALEVLSEEWSILGLGFRLQESGELIANVNWVDNVFILAPDVKQWQLMTQSLTGSV